MKISTLKKPLPLLGLEAPTYNALFASSGRAEGGVFCFIFQVMTMGLIDSIQNLINEHGSSSILRERLMMIREQLDKVENENMDLKKERSEMSEQIKCLNQEITDLRQ